MDCACLTRMPGSGENPVSSTQPCRLFSSFPARSTPAGRSPETTPATLLRPRRVPGPDSVGLAPVLLSGAVVCSSSYPNATIPHVTKRFPPVISLWPSAHLSVLCVEFLEFHHRACRKTDAESSTGVPSHAPPSRQPLFFRSRRAFVAGAP